MSKVQFSLFGNETISNLLAALTSWHKAFYYLRSNEEEPEYKTYRYKGGDILLCVYKRNGADSDTKEKILAKAVYLSKTKNGTFTISHFDKDVLCGIVDCRSKNILLDCFVERTELIDDLDI